MGPSKRDRSWEGIETSMKRGKRIGKGRNRYEDMTEGGFS